MAVRLKSDEMVAFAVEEGPGGEPNARALSHDPANPEGTSLDRCELDGLN
jgi:hypothetical protein